MAERPASPPDPDPRALVPHGGDAPTGRELQVVSVNIFPPAARAIGILVLTRDVDLFSAISQAVDPHRAARVDDLPQALALLETGDWGVVVADVQTAPPVKSVAAHLHRRFPAAVLVLAGGREDGGALLDSQAAGSIYRFLLKPLHPGQTRLFLESAVHHHLELLAALPPSVSRGRSRRGLIGIGALAAALLLIAAGLTWLYVPRPAPVSPEPEISAEQMQIAALLARAGQDAEAGDLRTAAAAYREILALSPGEAAIQAELTALSERALARAEQALVTSDYAAALSAVATAREIDPTNARLRFFDSQMEKERERRLLTSTREALEAGDVAEASDIALAALGSDAALEADADPETVSLAIGLLVDHAERAVAAGNAALAVELVERVRTASPQDPRLARAEQALAAEHARRVDAALAAAVAGNFTRARSELVAAAAIPQGEAALRRETLQRIEALERERGERDTARQDLESRAARASELVGHARDALAEGRLIASDNSAVAEIDTLAEFDPRHPQLQELRSMLAASLVERGRGALGSDDVDSAEGWLLEAEQHDPVQAAPLRADVDRLRAAAESVRVIPAGEMELVSYAPPQYPPLAARRNAEGWVDIEFTVGIDGVPREPQIVGGLREQYFTEAALAAVEQWRFRPREFRGQTIEQRVSARLRFEND